MTSSTTSGTHSLHWIDVSVIVVYFLFVILVGLWTTIQEYGRKLYNYVKSRTRNQNGLHRFEDVAMEPIPSKDSLVSENDVATEEAPVAEPHLKTEPMAEETKTSKNFFLANGNMGFVAIGCSLFASNIGAEHIIGLSGSGAKIGLAVGMAEWYSPIWILVLGWLFIPFYLKTQVFTLPEFVEKRFDRKSRMYLSVMSLVMYVMTKISVSIYAGAVVFQV